MATRFKSSGWRSRSTARASPLVMIHGPRRPPQNAFTPVIDGNRPPAAGRPSRPAGAPGARRPAAGRRSRSSPTRSSGAVTALGIGRANFRRPFARHHRLFPYRAAQSPAGEEPGADRPPAWRRRKRRGRAWRDRAAVARAPRHAADRRHGSPRRPRVLPPGARQPGNGRAHPRDADAPGRRGLCPDLRGAGRGGAARGWRRSSARCCWSPATRIRSRRRPGPRGPSRRGCVGRTEPACCRAAAIG